MIKYLNIITTIIIIISTSTLRTTNANTIHQNNNNKQHGNNYNNYMPTIADIENINNIFKNSKTYQEFKKQQKYKDNNDPKQQQRQQRRRRRMTTSKPATIDPNFIASIGKKYFTDAKTGGVISIAYKNNPKFCQGYGLANKARNESMTCNHLMQIASNTKAFTSLLSLVASKKKAIDLDEPIRINYPLFNPTSHSSGSNSADSLTMRDLLNHRTGMPRHDNIWQQPFSPRSGKITRKEIIESIQFLEMSRPQRIIAEYNNVMYTVAGAATANGMNILKQKQQQEVEEVEEIVEVENLNNDNINNNVQQNDNNNNNNNDNNVLLWEDYLETEILQPFGMTEGTYSTFGRVPKSEMSKFATPYNKDKLIIDPKTGQPSHWERSTTVMEFLNGDCVGPSMSVVSNGNDMYQYLHNLLHVFNPYSSSFTGDPKIDIDVYELLTSQAVYSYDMDTGFGKGQTYSYGWSKVNFNNENIFFHGGAMYGFSSFILLIPDLEFGIFAIDNKYNNAANVVFAIREIINTIFFNNDNTGELHQRMLLESSEFFNNNNSNNNRIIMEEEEEEENGNHNNPIAGRQQQRQRRRQRLTRRKKLLQSPSSSLQRYVGTYRHPAYGVFIIKLNTNQDGLLYSRPLSNDLNFYELLYVRDHIFKPKLRENTSFQFAKWLYFVDDPSGNIIFFLSQLANAKDTGGNIAPISFMKQSTSPSNNPLRNKWIDQEFRKLPFQYPRDDL